MLFFSTFLTIIWIGNYYKNKKKGLILYEICDIIKYFVIPVYNFVLIVYDTDICTYKYTLNYIHIYKDINVKKKEYFPAIFFWISKIIIIYPSYYSIHIVYLYPYIVL